MSKDFLSLSKIELPKFHIISSLHIFLQSIRNQYPDHIENSLLICNAKQLTGSSDGYIALKVGLSLYKKKFYLRQWKPFKDDEKCFSFHPKTFFPTQDI